jgi:hypothetical protein
LGSENDLVWNLGQRTWRGNGRKVAIGYGRVRLGLTSISTSEPKGIKRATQHEIDWEKSCQTIRVGITFVLINC